MARLDRLRDARIAVQREAVKRYLARTNEREAAKAIIAMAGPGAADSQERQAEYGLRTLRLNQLRDPAVRTVLPFGIERKMGATLDFSVHPPSEVARKAGRPVARLVDSDDPAIEASGFATGFLITADLLMTNWHVFPDRADAVNCAANFLYERNDRGQLSRGVLFALDPDRFYISDQALDFAILAISPRNAEGLSLADLGQNSLIEARPKILKGQPINIIQYPEGGPKQYAISQNRLVDILEAEGFLQYETDTLEGSSGSPAFSADWELVALHHASIPEMRDGKVIARDGREWTRAMGDDKVHWIANEGTRISAIVAHLRTVKGASPAEESILRDLVVSTSDPVANAAAALVGPENITMKQPQAAPAMGDMMDNSKSGVQFLFTGPVTINVSATAQLSAQMPAPSVEALEKSIRFDPDYDNREGYDPAFLGSEFPVPIPEIADARKEEILTGEDGGRLVLDYHHFSLEMNKVRRLQMWSAANVDYDPDLRGGNRKAFGTDRWIPDPRIPKAMQLLDADFYKPAGKIDRGHIVRREDNAWGKPATAREFANSDTFHWTNCTPQHEAFNRSSPGADYGREGLWGAFENYVQGTRTDDDTKACILAGPILKDSDPSEDFGTGPVQYPLAFWKVICVVEGEGGARKLKAFGFILSQADVVAEFGIEVFRPGRFAKYQKPLAVIAQRAGLVFDAGLLAADTKR